MQTYLNGVCACGCGKNTELESRAWAARGLVKGQPKKFCRGHNRRKAEIAGYRQVHRKTGSRQLHRIRAEAALGRSLPVGAVVHHADGTKSEQSPLVICQDEKYHHFLHIRMRVRRAGGDPNVDKWCYRCRSVKPKSEFHNNRRTFDGLHMSCKLCTRVLVAERWRKGRAA